MARIKVYFIEQHLRFCFGIIGKFIGLHPWYFLIIPLFLSGMMGAGFYFLEERTSNDIEKQFTPVDGRGKLERQYIQDTFPEDLSMFSSLRLSTEGIYATVILTHETNILSTEAFEEVLRIENIIREMTTTSGEETFKYSDICAKMNHNCFSNTLLDMVSYNASNFRSINITFPVHHSENGSTHMGYFIGGVNVDSNAVVLSTEAIRLFFYLQEDGEKSGIWLTEFIDVLSFESETTTQVGQCCRLKYLTIRNIGYYDDRITLLK